MKKLVLGMGTLALGMLTAGTAAGADEGGKEFGNPGVLAFGAKTGLSLGYENVSPPQGSSSSVVTFSLSPQISYFVIEGLSLGGEVLFSYTKPKNRDSTTVIGVGPIVGYNVWLVPGLLSLWPQLEALYTSTSVDVPSAAGSLPGGGTAKVFSIGAFVPLLIHPVRHFHFGIGPYVTTDLSSTVSVGGTSNDGDKTTSIGLRGEIGGWF